MLSYLWHVMGRIFLGSITIFLPLIHTQPPLPNGPLHFVATNGSDSNPGTLTAPYRTINRAIRESQAGHTVVIRGGIYNEPLIVNHAGESGRPITVLNYPDEVAIVDGSMPVTQWTPIGNGVYRASFTHLAAARSEGIEIDAAAASTCPDGYGYSGDRRASLFVDTTPSQSSWLRPFCILGSTPETSPGALPAGSFATDVPPPPGSQTYAGRTSTIYVHLADGSDPNRHLIRISAYPYGVFLGQGAAHIVLRGLTFRMALTGIHGSTPGVSNITLDGLDISLTKTRAIENVFCARGWAIVNNTIHDMEYEGIHIEGDANFVASNRIHGTIAPWSLYGSIGINVVGNDNRVSGNLISNIQHNLGGRGGIGIFLEEWYNGTGDVICHGETAGNNIIEHNRIQYVSRDGISISGGDGNTIRNNVFLGSGAQGINVEPGGTSGGPTGSQRNAIGNLVYNNSVYGSKDCGIALNAGAQSTVVRNNITYKNARGVYNVSSGATIDHNLTADPRFVNEAAGDFHLTSSSPAIDAGAVGLVSDDLDGVSRPQGNGHDIGAFEYRP